MFDFLRNICTYIAAHWISHRSIFFFKYLSIVDRSDRLFWHRFKFMAFFEWQQLRHDIRFRQKYCSYQWKQSQFLDHRTITLLVTKIKRKAFGSKLVNVEIEDWIYNINDSSHEINYIDESAINMMQRIFIFQRYSTYLSILLFTID